MSDVCGKKPVVVLVATVLLLFEITDEIPDLTMVVSVWTLKNPVTERKLLIVDKD